MSDLTEELGRLAELRDRGVLTQEEFDQQKARLLNPPVAPSVDPSPIPTAAPSQTAVQATPTPRNNTALYVIGSIVLVVALAGVLWATGAFRPLGLNPPGSDGNSSMAFNPMSLGSNTTMPTGFPTPSTVAPPIPMPTPSPSYPVPYPPSSGANPLLGSWEGNSSNKSSCPTRLMFSSTYLMFVATEGGSPQTKTINVVYNVQSPTSVEVSPQGQGHPATAIVTDNQMVLDDCGFTRG